MIEVGLIGLGNVGQGILNIIQENQALLTQRVGQPIHIKTIMVRDPKKYNHIDFGDSKITTQFSDLINDNEIKIIVEVIGGETPAYDYICQALEHGKYVVTANKEVVSKHQKTFFELAKKHQVDIYYEAAVGGGIPIIRSLKVGFSANKIESLLGILNGTTNYILTKIEQDSQEFDVTLKEAQELGLAEADPSMDISGLDAAHKLVILAAVAFKSNIQVKDVFYEGIENITLKDMKYAKELGFAIKLLALAKHVNGKQLSFKVHPTMIPLSHPLANIHNEMNAAYLKGNAVGEALLSGKGAGGSPTGSAIVSDIVDIAFDHTQDVNRRNLEPNLKTADLCPFEDTDSAFYIRLKVNDHHSVLEQLLGVLAKAEISVSKILQKEIQNNIAEIVIITHPTKEHQMAQSISELTDIDTVKKCCSVIRVEEQV